MIFQAIFQGHFDGKMEDFYVQEKHDEVVSIFIKEHEIRVSPKELIEALERVTK